MTKNADPTHPCGKCAFYSDSVWQPAEPGSVSVLAAGFSRQELEVGQDLFEQDAENRAVYCVSRGLIGLRTHHSNGKSTLLRLAYPGEIVGFRSFLGSGRHQTEARALLPSRICTVVRRDANRIVHDNPSVLARLMDRCVAEIDRSHERIIATATTSNKQRLSALLLRLMGHFGEQDGDSFEMRLPLSRSDLADLIGVQPETMSRLVKRLQNDGNFSFSGRGVWITPGRLTEEILARRS
ncbi:MAG: Crp/Fnr family transcriptional regulator [Rhodobacteraceae bacterium]|nr:Crp/Fnr family transcriptional regulator [Paracoccaceae bacterium]